MRRFINMLLMAILIFSSAILVSAQDERIPITFGERLTGEITDDVFETKYTFSGTAGQLVVAAMSREIGDYSLDSFLVLRDSDGDILAQNDDVLNGISLVVATLPADDDYTLLATRVDGRNGETTGPFWITLNEVQPLSSGTKDSVSIATEDEKRTPRFFVFTPDDDVTVRLSFSEETSGQYPQITLIRWIDDDYPVFLIDVGYMQSISSLSYTVPLEAGSIYVLTFDPVSIFFGSDMTAAVTFTVD